jgi:hypothetical protein
MMLSARPEDPVGAGDGAGGVGGVMQGLAEDDEVDGCGFDGWVFEVAQPELEVFESDSFWLWRRRRRRFFRSYRRR